MQRADPPADHRSGNPRQRHLAPVHLSPRRLRGDTQGYYEHKRASRTAAQARILTARPEVTDDQAEWAVEHPELVPPMVHAALRYVPAALVFTIDPLHSDTETLARVSTSRWT